MACKYYLLAKKQNLRKKHNDIPEQQIIAPLIQHLWDSDRILCISANKLR